MAIAETQDGRISEPIELRAGMSHEEMISELLSKLNEIKSDIIEPEPVTAPDIKFIHIGRPEEIAEFKQQREQSLRDQRKARLQK